MKKNSITGLVCFALALSSVAWAWDGDWTHARSGEGQGYIYDKKDSTGDAGTKERPQNFLIPPVRDYADVDPEELSDYFDRKNRHYSPYAMARITRELRYNNVVIPKGYYLVKPGDIYDGSPRTNLNTLYGRPANTPMTAPPSQISREDRTAMADADPSVLDGMYASIEARSNGSERLYEVQTPSASATVHMSEDGVGLRLDPMPVPEKDPPEVDKERRVYRTFVLKRLGKVVAVIPVHEMETYWPKWKEHIPRHALAWVEVQDQRPVLRFYYKHRIYSTYFQQ